MENLNFTSVEKAFYKLSGIKAPTTVIPYITVDNFPKLGLLTALRFLEWVSENPEGVISLPTGKTPEHFIKWTHYFLTNWNDAKAQKIRNDMGLNITN
jgi:glucosamine-6-phosphate deaminase